MQVGGVGVAQDRAERLVDLVGDRARQLAGDREPRRVREFEALLLHGLLGQAAAAAFDEEPGDQPGLQQEHDDGDDRLVPVLPPGTSAP